MSRKYGINIAEVSRSYGIPRSRIYRALAGETKNPSAETLRILGEVGLRSSPTAPRVIPGNVWDAAQELKLRDVGRLLNLSLKPLAQMSREELNHIITAVEKFPELYSWQGSRPPQ